MNNKSIERVAVVIINYKGIDDTIQCVESLSKQSYTSFDIILVENGSHDGSREQFEVIKEKNSAIITLYNDTNLGFTGGANTGIQWAQKNNYTYVALFNNDAIADTLWLESLLRVARENDEYGIVTGLLLHADGATIDSTGEQYSTWGLAFPRDRNKKTVDAAAAGLVLGATGGASLYRVSTLNEIGIFDNAFFAYYEDVDISFRAQLAGWKVAYTPTAIAYHKQGATSKKMPGFAVKQTFRNLPLLYIKDVPYGLLWSIGIRLLFAYIMMLGHAIKRGNAMPALKGFLQSIKLFWMVGVPARRVIQQHKKVKVSYIKSLLWPDLPPDQTGLRKVRRIFTGK
jgi:GT2 family glycosyltransferase